nr:MAG TPA: hypothetical protein [Caudoviricetes sp.]
MRRTFLLTSAKCYFCNNGERKVGVNYEKRRFCNNRAK